MIHCDPYSVVDADEESMLASGQVGQWRLLP